MEFFIETGKLINLPYICLIQSKQNFHFINVGRIGLEAISNLHCFVQLIMRLHKVFGHNGYIIWLN